MLPIVLWIKPRLQATYSISIWLGLTFYSLGIALLPSFCCVQKDLEFNHTANPGRAERFRQLSLLHEQFLPLFAFI